MRPIFYDTETTGVRPDKDRIIEIAAYDPMREEKFVQFVNPGMPIPAESTAITGINDEMVKNAPSFSVVGQNFINFCEGDVVLIAHNNDTFDKLFLDNEYKRAELAMPVWKYIDSLKWSRKYRTDLRSHGLQALREVYGIEANMAHRALDDVMVLYKVFSQMIDDLSWETIFSLMSQPQNISKMPFGKHQGKPLAEIPSDYVAWLKGSGAFDKSDNRELKEAFEKLGKL